MGKAANVLNALAIGIGGAAEGYGKGLLTVALRNRDEYYDRLREDRAAAREAAQMSASQGFQREMAGETRAFQREMSDTEWSREKEKMGMQEASDEKKMRLSAGLRSRGGGDGGATKPTAEMQEVNQLATVQARLAGREKPTDEDWIAAYREVNQRGKTGGIERTITDESGKVWGVTDTGEKIDLGLKSKQTGTDDSKVSAQQYFGMLSTKRQEINADITLMDRSPEEKGRMAKELLNQELDDAGVSYPGKGSSQAPAPVQTKGSGSSGKWDYQGSAEPASESDQESVSDVEQPGVLDAPATSGLGDTPTAGTPKGAGTERSPFIVDTPEEQQWFLEKAPEGSWVIYKGQKGQK